MKCNATFRETTNTPEEPDRARQPQPPSGAQVKRKKHQHVPRCMLADTVYSLQKRLRNKVLFSYNAIVKVGKKLPLNPA